MALIKTCLKKSGAPETLDIYLGHSTTATITAICAIPHDIATQYTKIKYTVNAGTPTSVKYASVSASGESGYQLGQVLETGTAITTGGATFTANNDLVCGVQCDNYCSIKITLYN
jgi:hypothetical protein